MPQKSRLWFTCHSSMLFMGYESMNRKNSRLYVLSNYDSSSVNHIV